MNLTRLVILFLGMCTGVQAQWREDFSLEPFHAYAPWKGDLSFWTQEQGWLKSQGPALSGSKIRLEHAVSASGDFELRFVAKLLLATSSNNYLEVELADSFSGNSLVVLLGGTPDEVSVFLRKSGGDSLLIDGQDKRLSSSTSNIVAVRLRLSGKLVSLDLGLQGDTSSWIREGVGTFMEFQPHLLQIRAAYSASNAAKFFMDALYFGVPERDTLPPQIHLVYDEDSVNWRIEWTENMDTGQGSLQDKSGNSVAFSWLNKKEMRCVVHGDVHLPVSLSGFFDVSGNVSVDTVLALHFLPYSFREIQITEIFPDPSPPAGLPEIEWIELFNAGTGARQLLNFVLSDLSSSHLFPRYLMEAGSRLILTSPGNCALLSSYGKCLELGFSGSFLNNSGDRLFLQNRQGDTLEWLEYSDQWHGDALKRNGGYSLEKIDPLNRCIGEAENFTTSPGPSGGSPGQLNSADQRIIDTIAPHVLSFSLLGPSRIEMQLNEAIDTKKARFFFEQDSLPLAQFGLFRYQVNFPDPLPDNASLEYQATLLFMEDCQGNTQDQSLRFRYAIPALPAPHELIFTELFFKPNTGQKGFVEVYNRSEKAQSLAGTALLYDEKSFFLSNYLLYPGEALILCKVADTAYFSGLPYLAPGAMPVLNAKSGQLALKNIYGELLDAIHYSDTQFQSWPQKALGYSLQRIDSSRACSYPGDWQPSVVYGGEPGVHLFKQRFSEEIIPALQEIYPESNRHVRLRFSAPIATEQPDFKIFDAWGSPAGWELVSNDFCSWLLEWSDSLLHSKTYHLEISGLRGCNEEMMPKQQRTFRLAEGAKDLRINEILADPVGDDPDYVELYNAGSEAIDLKGLKLCNLHADGSLNEQVPISTDGYLLMPGAYVVLTEAHHRLSVLYGYDDERKVQVMNSLPSFPNALGSVVVIDSFGNVLDSFRYSDKYHSQILINTEGVSLERINSYIRTDQGNNWTSASASANFGTPGRINSQSREGKLPETRHWELVSPTFSPDGDGFEDLALLVYSGLEAGSIVAIHVYSLAGQLVYEWANNLPCGSSGTLKWEGYDARGESLPDGPYVLWIRVTNQQGQSKRERLVLVKTSPLND